MSNIGPITIKDNNKIKYEENLIFYKKEFCKLQEKNRIKNDMFDDSTWIFKKGNYNCYCNFNNLKFPKFKNSIKAFCIERLSKNYDSHDLVKKVNYIFRMLDYTNGFDFNYIDIVKKNLAEQEIKSKNEICSACVIFLNFMDIDDEYASYINLFKQYTRKENKVRQLPSYKSIIEFDYILSEYFLDKNNNINKYFPILLWWRITSVIPMRPIEFLTLKKDCCYKQGPYYYLNINRRNKDKNNPEIKTTVQKLKVNENIYKLISQYNDIVKINCNQEDREYLLSYELYNKYLKKPNLSLKSKFNTNFLEMRQLHQLLKNFYNEIIYNKYDKNVEKIKLGDTRHLAFCSLMLQGIDPITIANIGFHKKLSTQILYESHLETFVYSYTYILANKIKQVRNNERCFNIGNILKRDEFILKSKLLMYDCNRYTKVENGYCTDEKFPLNCGNLECIDCNYYILQNYDNDTTNLLNKKINSYLTKVKEDLIAMRYFAHKSMNTKDSSLMEENKNTLLAMSNSIQREIVKSANMIAQL